MKLPFPTVLAVLLLFSTTYAAPPEIIHHQGRVTSGGVNFTGAGSFRFALVNAAGTTSYWSNDLSSAAGSEPTAAVPVTVTGGLYAVGLGDTALTNMTASIPASVFAANNEIYLRIWFDDGTNGSQQLTPDQRLTSVGYALAAASLTGFTTNPSSFQVTFGQGTTASGNRAVAWGDNTTASGANNATAFGFNTNASGNSATAWGATNTASGQRSTAWGISNDATDLDATAFGNNNIARRKGSTAWGTNTTAGGTTTGDWTTAWGTGSVADGHRATAFGNFTNANGNDATAFGSFAAATANRATAWGLHTDATAVDATAFGDHTEASADHATAFGETTTAGGTNSTAWGSSTTAQQTGATAWGTMTTAGGTTAGIGEYATAWGNGASATFDNATAFGRDTLAAAAGATAWGQNTTASGNFATALGRFTNAESLAEVALGRFDTDYAPLGVTSWNAADRLFVIGNGTGAGARNDALVMLKNGDTTLDGDFATTGDFKYASPRTVELHVPGAAFTPQDDTVTYLNSDAGFIALRNGGNLFFTMIAPVQLPVGATVTSVSFRIYDNSINDITDFDAALNTQTITGAGVQSAMASFSNETTTGASTSIQVLTDNTILNATVTADRYYMIRVNFQASAFTTSVRFYGATIEYTLDTLTP